MEYSTEQLKDYQRQIANLENENNELNKKLGRFRSLKNTLSDLSSAFDSLKSPLANMVDLSDSGKENFLKGACYCGEEIGASTIFNTFSEYYTVASEDRNKNSDTISSTMLLCEEKMKEITRQINTNLSEISRIRSMTGTGGAGGGVSNKTMQIM